MKKTILKVMLVCACAFCATNASAQSILSKLKSTSSSSSSSSSDSSTGSSVLSSLSSALGNLIGTSSVSASSISGDWSYTGPAIAFESESLLKSAGGSVVANQLESKMETYLEKLGFEEGKVKLNFDGSSSFTLTVNSKDVSGTYSISESTITFSRSGLSKSVSANISLSGSDMQITFEADKLLDFVSSIASLSSSSLMSTVSSLADSYDGMQLGFEFEKE